MVYHSGDDRSSDRYLSGAHRPPGVARQFAKTPLAQQFVSAISVNDLDLEDPYSVAWLTGSNTAFWRETSPSWESRYRPPPCGASGTCCPTHPRPNLEPR